MEKELQTKQEKYADGYIIFNRQMAYLLRKTGYKLLRTEPNRYKPELDIYIFEWSETFESALNNYKKQLVNKNQII